MKLDKERHTRKRAAADSERILAIKTSAISELEAANMQLQKQLGLIEVSWLLKRQTKLS